MELLLRFLDLALTAFEHDLVIPGLTTGRTCLKSGKWACVFQTAINSHIVDKRGNTSHLGNLCFYLSI